MDQMYHIKNNLKKIINECEQFIEKKDNNLLVFTRINTDTIKCSFCDKYASYVNIDNKHYCWFHRSIHENNI
jgi:hypothetical protein